MYSSLPLLCFLKHFLFSFFLYFSCVSPLLGGVRLSSCKEGIKPPTGPVRSRHLTFWTSSWEEHLAMMLASDPTSKVQYICQGWPPPQPHRKSHRMVMVWTHWLQGGGGGGASKTIWCNLNRWQLLSLVYVISVIVYGVIWGFGVFFIPLCTWAVLFQNGISTFFSFFFSLLPSLKIVLLQESKTHYGIFL